MRFRELVSQMGKPLFTVQEVRNVFRDESAQQINVQLKRMVDRGDLVRLKRGIYRLADKPVDELVLASWLYQPSYVSLESALQIAGMIPEQVMQVTSVTPLTTKKLTTSEGVFLYSKMAKELFFGYEKVESGDLFYNLALPEKALLDYVYIRKVKDLEEARVSLEGLDWVKLRQWGELFPSWVLKMIEGRRNE